MQERDAVHRAAPALHFACADDAVRCFQSPPFTSTSGLQARIRFKRRVFVEFYHHADRFQRRKHHHAVLLGVDRPVVALALAFHRGIAVHADDQRCTQCAGLREISHMAAMQHVETAVGEYQRARQCGRPCGELAGRA